MPGRFADGCRQGRRRLARTSAAGDTRLTSRRRRGLHLQDPRRIAGDCAATRSALLAPRGARSGRAFAPATARPMTQAPFPARGPRSSGSMSRRVPQGSTNRVVRMGTYPVRLQANEEVRRTAELMLCNCRLIWSNSGKPVSRSKAPLEYSRVTSRISDAGTRTGSQTSLKPCCPYPP
jgi:hypothetical protein